MIRKCSTVLVVIAMALVITACGDNKIFSSIRTKVSNAIDEMTIVVDPTTIGTNRRTENSTEERQKQAETAQQETTETEEEQQETEETEKEQQESEEIEDEQEETDQ